MLPLYLFALVLGGGFLLLSVLGGESDADIDLDLDGEVGGGEGAEAAKILSFRTVVYALFAFGATGVVLDRLGIVGSTALLASTVTGVTAGVGVGGLFAWLARTESGATAGDAALVGLVGKVTIPMSTTVPGTVVVNRGGRRIALRALPHGSAPRTEPEQWNEVLVVEMEAGVARVTSLEDPLLTEGEPPEGTDDAGPDRTN